MVDVDVPRDDEAVTGQARAQAEVVILEAAGASAGDVAQVLVTLTDRAHRPLVNDCWVELFPDPGSRPARNTSERDLPGGSLCQLIAYAFVS